MLPFGRQHGQKREKSVLCAPAELSSGRDSRSISDRGEFSHPTAGSPGGLHCRRAHRHPDLGRGSPSIGQDI